MELAKLFASVGFKVETDGLTKFRQELQAMKTEMKEIGKATGQLKGQLTGLNAQLKKFQSLVDPKNLTAWHKSMTTALGNFYRIQNQNAQSQFNATRFADAFIISISRLHTAMLGRVPEIKAYSDAIAQLASSFQALKAATAGIQRFRQVPSTALTQTQGGAGGSRRGSGRRGNGYEDNQYIGYWGRASGIAKSPLAAFVRPMLPTGMGLFNAVAGGYAFKELVKTGREMMSMEQTMKAVSDDSAQFMENMRFTKDLAFEMGLNVKQVGDSFGNIFMAAKQKMSSSEIQQMFRGFNKYYTASHMGAEDQRLANLAIQQMFGKDKIQAQEARLQMGQRVKPFMHLLAEAGKENIKGWTNLDDMMKKGMLDPTLLKYVADKLGKIAETNNAYSDSLKNSIVAQNRFNNEMSYFASDVMKGGLDHLLASLFNIGSSIIQGVKPAIPYIIKLTQTLMDLLQWISENKKILLLFGGLVVEWLGTKMAIAAVSVASMSVKLWGMVAALKGAKLAALELKIAFGLFLFVLDSVFEYFNGEDNWVHGLILVLDQALLTFEEFFLKVELAWMKFKDSFSVNPIGTAKNVIDGTNKVTRGALSAVPGVGAILNLKKGWDEAVEMHDYLVNKSPVGQAVQNTNTIVTNVTIDASTIPQGVSVGVLKEYGKAHGDAVGKAIDLSSVGLWGK